MFERVKLFISDVGDVFVMRDVYYDFLGYAMRG